MSNSSFQVIDLEASALVGGYPISVAIVRADGAMFYSLVRPEPEWIEHGRWDPNAEHLHGISLDRLKSEGRPAREIVEEINARFAGWLHSDAPGHDLRWLQELRDAAGIELRANIVAKEVETTLRELAEANETPRAKINEIFNLERATHNHHALHDAAAWVAVRESITRWETEEPTSVFARWKDRVNAFLKT
jgi:DNA polymerase III epsilon subunit-like protein